MEITELSNDTETLGCIREHCNFEGNSVYLLIAMARPKENDQLTHGDRVTFRQILTDEDTLERKYNKLSTLCRHYEPLEGGELTFRMYISANRRDTDKALSNYIQDVVDMRTKILQGHDQTSERIKRMDREWESHLQKDGSRDEKRFVIDVDVKDRGLLQEVVEELPDRAEIHGIHETPNGYHILVSPFNYTSWAPLEWEEEIELKKDSLLFLRIGF